MEQPPPLSDDQRKEYARRAFWSCLLGLAAFFLAFLCIGPIFAVPAFALGLNALNGLKRTGGLPQDIRRAKQGLWLGLASIAVGALVLCAMFFCDPHSKKPSQKAACINYLRLIDSMKQQWQLDKGTNATAMPTENDLAPYFLRAGISWHSNCPAGGIYRINATNELPTCTIPDHVLTQ